VRKSQLHVPGASNLFKEELMRKAFRMATAFTGAVACAAAFTPAATAATPKTHELKAPEVKLPNPRGIKPDMEKKNCAIGPRTTSVVFYWPTSAHHGPTCVGGAGAGSTISLSNHLFANVCFGNNDGYFWHSHYQKPYSFSYGSQIVPINMHVDAVQILSWPGGNTRCPTTGVP
jgi:hypothetical protein